MNSIGWIKESTDLTSALSSIRRIIIDALRFSPEIMDVQEYTCAHSLTLRYVQVVCAVVGSSSGHPRSAIFWQFPEW